MSDEIPGYGEFERVNAILLSEHERIVAELRAEVIRLNSNLGFLIGVMEGIVVYADDADMRREFARRALEKIAALEGEK